MLKISPEAWKADLHEFKEKTDAFYAGEINKNEYKGFSGGYGSYAQRGGTASMLRLRLPGGRLPKEKLGFIADCIEKHQITKVHLTTCQTIQLHNLQPIQVYEIIEQALDYGIVTRGGGGDFPRNVMVSPLSGVEKEEFFDVLPYAEAAGEYLMTFIKAEKMPRKLKVCFSNSPANSTHATFRDLGFVARPDRKFDVYSAGGLGNNPKFGIKVAEAINPSDVLYYICAMWKMFLTHGNYTQRAKARTRYMQDTLGEKEFLTAFHSALQEALHSGENLTLIPESISFTKQGDGTTISGKRIIEQKQPGLYTVSYHPIGGCPAPSKFRELANLIQDMEDVELRLSPDEGMYIINLTGAEARKVLAATEDGAQTLLETSVACIGASICQAGVRDSQQMLADILVAARAAGIKDGALPQLHISGCPSSCGTHQTGEIGFHGCAKRVNNAPAPAFTLHVNGCDAQGEERFGRQLGVILADQIPAFLVELGTAVQNTGMTYSEWKEEHMPELEAIAAKYI